MWWYERGRYFMAGAVAAFAGLKVVRFKPRPSPSPVHFKTGTPGAVRLAEPPDETAENPTGHSSKLLKNNYY